MPSLSLMPHSVIIRRAWSVAILMSPAAPLDTLSGPKMISSAARPPIAMVSSASSLDLLFE